MDLQSVKLTGPDGELVVGPGRDLALFCGPCVIENRDDLLFHAEAIKGIASRVGLPLIFKSSYDKANRTSLSSFRGVGLEQGLRLLEEVRRDLNIPVVTDVHSPEDVPSVVDSVDVVQIPAFLCRQTDLLVAAGSALSLKPEAAVLIKKGQFLAPEDMRFAVEKVKGAGGSQILLCERGACFGYRELIVDYRSLDVMSRIGCPVVFDATHSVQVMGGAGGASSGNRELVPLLARAAVAAGVSAVFLESHRDPDKAPSDGANMIALDNLEGLLTDLKALHDLKLSTRDSVYHGGK